MEWAANGGSNERKEGKMGMKVGNGMGLKWPCAWDFIHAGMERMWWLEREMGMDGGCEHVDYGYKGINNEKW